MNKKTQVISGIIGGIVGSIITAFVVSSVTAQKDKFGEIECTKLTVVDAKGKPRILIGTDIIGSDYNADTIRVRVIGHGLGAFVSTYGKDGKSGAALAVEHLIGGSVMAYDNDGTLAVELKGERYRRGVRVFGKQGKRVAALGIDEYGNGAVSTWDKNGNRQ